MRYTLTLRDEDLEKLRSEVFSMPGFEGAAFLLCGESRTGDEVRLLGREIIAVAPEDYEERRPDFLSIAAPSYVRVAKRAKVEGLSVVFVHSHPGGYLDYSDQDNREEPKLQEFLVSRAPERLHGSLILTETGIIGRVWTGNFEPMSLIRVIGRRFEFHGQHSSGADFLRFFDRQVAAFGPETQSVLRGLHIGVVGAGGTGSAVIEQLTRLGVGKLTVFDGDSFHSTNVNRVYGSRTTDAGRPKVEIARRNSDAVGVGTDIQCFPAHITNEAVAKELRACDVVFGCTDTEASRAILMQLSLWYLIPVLDLGVKIESEHGTIRDVVGRVTTLMPGEACLLCREWISPEGIHLESLTDEERKSRAREGYAPELQTRAPAVVPFTTGVAAMAVSELMHRLTGYMGEERHSTELLIFFDQTRIVKNRVPPEEECICGQRRNWGRGDTRRFLGMSWSS